MQMHVSLRVSEVTFCLFYLGEYHGYLGQK